MVSNARAGGGERRLALASGHVAAARVRWRAAGDTNAAVVNMQNQRLCPAMEDASEVASSPLLRMVVEEHRLPSSAAGAEARACMIHYMWSEV